MAWLAVFLVAVETEALITDVLKKRRDQLARTVFRACQFTEQNQVAMQPGASKISGF